MGSELNDEPINISMAQEGPEACVCIVLVRWRQEDSLSLVFFDQSGKYAKDYVYVCRYIHTYTHTHTHTHTDLKGSIPCLSMTASL